MTSTSWDVGRFAAYLLQLGDAVRMTSTGKLRIKRDALEPEDRAWLKDNREAVTQAYAALRELEALEVEERAEEDSLWALVEESQRRRKRQYRLDHLATWDEAKVRALAKAGKLTPQDIKDWHESRAQLQRRAYLKTFAGMLATSLGMRGARVIEHPAVIEERPQRSMAGTQTVFGKLRYR